VRPRYFLDQQDFIDRLETVTYAVETWHERRGTACRRKEIAVVEGHKILLPHESWEIEREMSKLPWEPIEEPSILRTFDSWFNWTLYRKTLLERDLHGEFIKYRMA